MASITSSTKNTTHRVFVAGSTGATGEHVVQKLLDRGDSIVVAVTRSKEKLMGLLNRKDNDDKLIIKEASIGDLSIDELKELTKECSAVITCLGHNLTFRGTFKDGYFVSDSVKKLTACMPQTSRYIHMNSEMVAHPDGITDPKRSRFDLSIVWLIRLLLPPVKDMEMSAWHLHTLSTAKSPTTPQQHSLPWCNVRPGDLYNIEDQPNKKVMKSNSYDIFDHPRGSLFDSNSISRTDVADFLVDLATMEERKFQENYNHKMPVIYQK